MTASLPALQAPLGSMSSNYGLPVVLIAVVVLIIAFVIFFIRRRR